MGDVVDVIRYATEKIATRSFVDVTEWKPVDFVFDGRSEPPHGAMDDTSEQETLGVGESARTEIQRSDKKQRSMK